MLADQEKWKHSISCLVDVGPGVISPPDCAPALSALHAGTPLCARISAFGPTQKVKTAGDDLRAFYEVVAKFTSSIFVAAIVGQVGHYAVSLPPLKVFGFLGFVFAFVAFLSFDDREVAVHFFYFRKPSRST